MYKGKWSACDKPMFDKKGFYTESQKLIDDLVGIYLLAKGEADREFGYIRIKKPGLDLLVLQTRRFYNAPISDAKLTSSLFKYLADYKDPIVVPSPYPSDVGRDEQVKRLEKIRQNIAIYHAQNRLESSLAYPYGSGIGESAVEYPHILQPVVYNKLRFTLEPKGEQNDRNTEKD